ncbi:YciI family protein [Acidimangrovimonas sediminis]|uniref:YciI family protein n=1 Tax=Acidimangrovimonas sediminis TaxID=2056283 RepID=UPI000C8103A0|nr:YciI family protein [Acidimangrovimonas sediminis]
MTTYAVICRDKPGALDIRKATRDRHLAYLNESSAVTLAGPFVSPEGEMCGSLLLIEADSLAAARDWAAGDPYAKAGLFAEVSVQEWKKVIG